MNLRNHVNLISQILFSLLLLLFIYEPAKVFNLANHDVGSAAAIEYWLINNFSFGRDIIQNVGPFGFLNYSQVFTGMLDEIKLFFNVFLIIITSILIFQTIKSYSLLLRILIIVCGLIYIQGDMLYYFLISLISFYLFINNNFKLNLCLIILLSILSLTKGTFLILSFSIILVLTTSDLFLKRFKSAFFYLILYFLFLLIFWVLSGQQLFDFFYFLNNMFIFTDGYNEAMSSFESKEMLILGLSCFLLTIFNYLYQVDKLKYIIFKNDINFKFLCFILAQLGIIFVVWKHGFVRADQHVLTFFQFIILNHLIFFSRFNAFFSKYLENKNYTIINVVLFITVFLMCNLGISVNKREIPFENIYNKIAQLEYKFFAIFNYKEHFNQNNKILLGSKKNLYLNETQEIVENNTLGYFGKNPGIPIYNNFNYINSPAIISFGTPNLNLIKKEFEFYNNDKKAPTYLIYDLRTIDNRIPSGDSGYAQLEIFHRYKIVHLEKQLLVLKRKDVGIDLIKKKIKTFKTTLNKTNYLPNESKDIIEISLRIKKNFFYKVVSFLYKPPQYFIELEYQNSNIKKFRLIPGIANAGIVINPNILNNSHVLTFKATNQDTKLFNEILSNRVKSYKIGCDQLTFLCNKDLEVTHNKILNLERSNLIDLKYNYVSGSLRKLDGRISDQINNLNNNNSLTLKSGQSFFFIKPKKYKYLKGKFIYNYNEKRVQKNEDSFFVTFIKFVKNIIRPLNTIKRNITSNRKIIFTIFNKNGKIVVEEIELKNMSASENLSIKLPFEKGYLLIDYKGDNEELNSFLKFTSLDLELSD